MRIWQQGISDFNLVPSYTSALAAHVKRVASPGVVVDLHGVVPGSYPHGIAPIEALKYSWCELLLSTQMVTNAVQAEREGYDAVALTCFLDPALDEARASVDIPVVSILESSLLIGNTVGHRLGLVGLGRDNAECLRDRLSSKPGGDRVVSVVGLEPPVTELELDDPKLGTEVERRFESCAAIAIRAGANLIVPAEGFLNVFLAQRNVREVDGIPVLDSFGVLIAHAEMMIHLWAKTGLRMSRHGKYARPDDALYGHVTKITSRSLSSAAGRSAK